VRGLKIPWSFRRAVSEKRKGAAATGRPNLLQKTTSR
jgi:hypothetical protein